MLDDLDHLRNSPHLVKLLSQYAHLGAENRQIWQGRLMVMEGIEPPQLVKLHGQLIAFTWVEQNTGEIPCCYRITAAGLRAMRRVQAEDDSAEAEADQTQSRAA